ncbi:proton-coupled zinc antiporter SLC30A1 isoform X2 [Procambarus clarkii]|uniref:proton-coupled zinc antiporter SLC30A1 isoform X2 n=1 Tax=Procambarus clarkii TaxID=6728 RepID=UPI003743E597
MTMAAEKSNLLSSIPRVKLWVVLVLTLVFTVVLLGASHLTHSLTLRVEAYHTLYNLLSLIGCLLTMKLCSGPQSLHNTFGWARLEVLSMLTTQLFLTALCFSAAIDSVQTAVHVGHQDAMHHPLKVMALGAVGGGLNALVFCLIGGYTHHQGCFLEMRDSGSVWVGRQVTQEAVQAGRRMLSSSNLRAGSSRPISRIRQVINEVLRDNCGLVMVEVCAAVVYWDDGGTVALYIDPALAVTSAALLMWFSYPYGRECCHILLQTIPGHIDVEAFQVRILEQFPAVVNIHHLHIWTFTPTKVVATAHVVFKNPRVYLSVKDILRDFFVDEGVTQVTLQPEYMTREPGASPEDGVCLLRCEDQDCHERECCRSCPHHPLLLGVSSHGEVSSQSKDSPCEAGTCVCGSRDGVCGSRDGVCGSGNGVCGSGNGVCGSGNGVCGSGNGVCGSRDGVCGSRDDVCGSRDGVCGSGDGVCGSGNGVCGSGDGVCGSGDAKQGAEDAVNESCRGASEPEDGRQIKHSSDDGRCQTYIFPCLPDSPGDQVSVTKPTTTDQHTQGSLVNDTPSQHSKEHLATDGPTLCPKEHLATDGPTLCPKEHLATDGPTLCPKEHLLPPEET